MSNALSIAASGLKSQEYQIEKIAHDLSNLNTANYKSSKIIFTDLLNSNAASSNSSMLQAQKMVPLGLGSSIFKTVKDFSEGPLKPTNNWNDVAIDGPGFFQVINSDGTLFYTRNSSFMLDEDRYLATQDGLRLADNIQIPEDFREILIQKNGDVEAILDEDSTPQLLGTIQLTKFLNPESLKMMGSGFYQPMEDSAEPIVDNPGSSGLGFLNQKQIEGSNVDMVDGLMQLTFAQRIYQLSAKAVQIADEMEKITNEIRN